MGMTDTLVGIDLRTRRDLPVTSVPKVGHITRVLLPDRKVWFEQLVSRDLLWLCDATFGVIWERPPAGTHFHDSGVIFPAQLVLKADDAFTLWWERQQESHDESPATEGESPWANFMAWVDSSHVTMDRQKLPVFAVLLLNGNIV